MASITFDGQSIMIDGRRQWLVGGTIHYTRVPRDLWADRVHAAKLAGLNAVEVPVIWARHEPRPGHFSFKGDDDLRHFVTLIGKAGMHCILRPGPYVGAGWSLGGMPAWLLTLKDIRLRTNSGPFLEACSRYVTALAEQVRDLQVSGSGRGGPILLVQIENAWTCGHDDLARAYLGELQRYVREAGFTVPVVNANRLWQSVEGEIDCWSGSSDLLASLRQLATIRPSQPRIVIDLATGDRHVWGRKPEADLTPDALERRLCEVLAGAGQYNLRPFHAGVATGFSAGRSADGAGLFYCPSGDAARVLAPDGSPGTLFQAARRVSTFASRFARVFSSLSPQHQPVVIDPSRREPRAQSRGAARRTSPRHSVVHVSGSQGGVAFVFADEHVSRPQDDSAQLLLPDGVTLPVPLGGRPAAWCLFDVLIGSRSSLDYCNLSALGVVGKVFVCFGPTGARAMMAVNGSPVEVTVPSGKAPEVIEIENIFVVVCSLAQADATYFTDDAVYVGVAGLTADGRPVVPEGSSPRSVTRISAEGVVTTGVQNAARPPAHENERPHLGAWSMATTSEYVDGTSPRFASIAGPADLGTLGSPYGYGWYRVTFKSPARGHSAFPQSGDRLHVFRAGESLGVAGVGPGAIDSLDLAVRKAGDAIVVLAENFGHFAGGTAMAERKGLFGHVWQCEPVRVGKPEIEVSAPLEPLALRAPLWEVRQGDATLPERLGWSIPHRRRTPLVVTLRAPGGGALPARGLLVLNDKPIDYFDRAGLGPILIDAESLSRGVNSLQLAILPDIAGADGLIEPVGDHAELAREFAECIQVSEGAENLSESADWAFARWEPPPASAYEPNKGAARTHHHPTWWKTVFKTPHSPEPLYLDVTGLSKGQIYLNGRHLGPYFASTADGKAVGPQVRHLLPAPWLAKEGENDLVLFDEHGAHPTKARLAFGEKAAIRAAL